MAEAKSRRDEYSEASRRALLDSARTLFVTQGYGPTSLDEIAAAARLTKGAVYHHFANKLALFEAVLDEVEQETLAKIITAAAGAGTAWEGGVAGLEAFLDECLDPVYQRLCFVEGPAAMGFVRWWECGEQYEIGVIKAMVLALQAEGFITVEADHADVLTRILFGAMAAGALSIARAEDPAAERDAIRDVVLHLISGLRTARPDLRPSGR